MEDKPKPHPFSLSRFKPFHRGFANGAIIVILIYEIFLDRTC